MTGVGVVVFGYTVYALSKQTFFDARALQFVREKGSNEPESVDGAAK